MRLTMDIDAVLFDLDGTLVDSAPDLGAAADQMRIARGLPSLPQEAYRCAASSGARGLLGAAFGMTPGDGNYAAYCEEFLSNYEQRLLMLTSLFVGTTELLRSLAQRGMPWGIVTNKAARFTEPIVRGLADLQPAMVVISGDTLAHAKPHPAPLLEAARRLAIEPARCLYVGDDLRDMQAARAAGMAGMAALWGYMGDAPVNDWGADALAHQPCDVLAWVEQRVGV